MALNGGIEGYFFIQGLLFFTMNSLICETDEQRQMVFSEEGKKA